MKKLSLLLLLPLLTTSAYSGGDTFDDDEGFVHLVAPKAEKPIPMMKVKETLVEESAEGESSSKASESSEKHQSAQTDPEQLSLDLCELCAWATQKVSEGAKQQWKKVPACPCVRKEMESGRKKVDDLLKELREFMDTGVKKYREEGIPFFGRTASDEKAELVRLRKENAKQKETIDEQVGRLKLLEKVQKDVETLSKILEATKKK